MIPLIFADSAKKTFFFFYIVFILVIKTLVFNMFGQGGLGLRVKTKRKLKKKLTQHMSGKTLTFQSEIQRTTFE